MTAGKEGATTTNTSITGRGGSLSSTAAGRLGAALTGLVLAVAALSIAGSAWWSWPVAGHLKDFGSFVASGRAASAGKDPFAVYPLTYRVALPGQGLVVANPNLNPPISVPFFQLLGPLEPLAAHRAWYVASLALYLGVVALLVRAYPARASAPRVAWALCLAGMWNTIELGQIYLPLLLAATVAWLRLERGSRVLPGVLIGVLVAFKPHFALWPALLALAGYWVTALAALGSVVALSALPAAIYGPGIYGQWAAAVLAYQGMLIPTNLSLEGLAVRLGAPLAGAVLAALLGVGVAVWAWRRRPETLTVSGVALAASLLIWPLTWPGYTLVLLPALFSRAWARPVRLGAILLAYPTFLAPLFFSVRPGWHIIVLSWVYGWGTVLILAGLAWEAWRGARSNYDYREQPGRGEVKPSARPAAHSTLMPEGPER